MADPVRRLMTPMHATFRAADVPIDGLGSLPRARPGVDVFHVLGRILVGSHFGAADSGISTAVVAAIAVMAAARVRGRSERGSGCARRSALWLRPHSA
jgi:hypothetical protein